MSALLLGLGPAAERYDPATIAQQAIIRPTVQYPQPLNFLATFGAVLLHEGDQIFRFQRVGLTPDNKIIGHFTATGVRSHYSERFRLWGYDLPPSIYEPTRME